MAPLITEFRKNKSYDVKVLVTAQHRELLDQVLLLFNIKPDFDFDLMKPGQSLSGITVSILGQFNELFSHYFPDLVFVHGDTTTSFATALACFYKNIDVAHVEAGLRTNDIKSPFPEEFNRQVVSKIAKFHFAPTLRSEANLMREGIEREKILVTGNTVIDALFQCLNLNPKLELPLEINKPYILITAHRRENFGQGFINICHAIKILSDKYKSFEFIYPVHPNPNVLLPVKNILRKIPNVKLVDPVDYYPFVQLMKNSFLILTDSGGVQEEAPSLGVPVLVMRETSERPEAIEAGTVKLVGTNTHTIVTEVSLLIESVDEYRKMQHAHNPYGDGNACSRILDFLKVQLVSDEK